MIMNKNKNYNNNKKKYLHSDTFIRRFKLRCFLSQTVDALFNEIYNEYSWP